MKLFYRLMLLLTGLAFITSCSEDDFDREPVLGIIQKSLEFSKEGGIQSVIATINDGDELDFIVRAGGGDWISVAKSRDGFDVSVTENETSMARNATIEVLILKGNLTETITVTQSDASYIRSSEESINFSYLENEMTLYIESNSPWELTTVDGEGDWLTVDQTNIAKNKLALTAIENTEIEERIATITLTNTSLSTVVVTVTQNGIIHYDFPILELGYIYEGAESERGLKYPRSLPNAYTFEKKRGNRATGVSGYIHNFISKSTLFPMVHYYTYQFMDERDRAAVRSILLDVKTYDDALILKDDPAFLAYVGKQGFDLAWNSTPDSISTYWNKDKQVALQVFHSSGVGTHKGITFTHSPMRPNAPDNQVDAFKTLDALPAFLEDWKATAPEIRAWELAQGSTEHEDSSPTALIFIPSNKDIVERVYYIGDTGTPIEILFLINNMERGLYHTGSFNEDYAYAKTREFTALAESNGYVYKSFRNAPPAFVFNNATKKTYMIMYLQRFNAEGIIPRLCITIMPAPDAF